MPDQPTALKETQRIHYYRSHPAEWMTKYLGIRPETLWWSMNDGYETHSWDSRIQFPGEKQARPCPNPIVTLLRCWAAGYNRIALQSAANVGKAQPLSEVVQTPDGPTPMGDIELGDDVIGLDGRPTRVIGTYPQGEREIYRVVLRDGTEVEADRSHIWKVRTSTDRVKGRDGSLYMTEQIKDKLENGGAPERGYWIPTPDPVQHSDRTLPIDPYVLGVLIGDGGLTSKVDFSSGDKFIVDELRSRTPPHISVSSYDGPDYALVDRSGGKTNEFKTRLKRLGLFGKKAHEKFVPEDYFLGSLRQRRLLLQGLMDSDGWVSSGGSRWQFGSSSIRLRDDVCRLVCSLGGSASKRQKERGQYRKCYGTSIRLPEGLSPFKLPRKADKVSWTNRNNPGRKIDHIEKVGRRPAKCIKVAAADQMYLTRGYVATHNTYTMSAGVLHYLDTHRPSLVKTYAPTGDTLEDQIFGHIGEFQSGLNGAPGFGALHPKAEKHNDLNLYMDPESDSRSRWKASGETVEAYAGEQAEYGAESAAGAQGAHAEWMTLIIEEAPGVHSSIWNALDMTLGQKNTLIAYGNPDSESDPLNEFAQRDSVLRIRVSALDHPNYVTGEEVVPGAFNPDQIHNLQEKYGGEDHPLWKSRIRGICPRTAGACLFKEQALESVEEHFRQRGGDGERLSDQPWKDPLFRIEHDPGRWRPALLRLAEAGGWSGGESEGSIAEEVEEEALGIFDVEGHTNIYAPPKFDYIGRYCIGADVAGDYAEGDAHSAFVYDRIERHVVAEIHLRGPREAYALQLLALAQAYRVPYQRDPDLAEGRDEDPQAWVARRYLEAERKVRKEPTGLGWPGRQQSYPKLAWETEGVGSLHKIGPFKGYPNKYYDRDPGVKGGKRSRRMGWQTRGNRDEMVENLRDWHHLLAYDPQGCPSEGLLSEMKTFKRNKDKDRYEAETGEHDDRVMAHGICLTVSDRIPDPTETKTPDPTRQLSERARRSRPDTSSGPVWSGVAQNGTWGVPNHMR